MIPAKLAMHLVDVTIICRCKHPKVLKVLSQGLCGVDGVNGGKPHYNLGQQRLSEG